MQNNGETHTAATLSAKLEGGQPHRSSDTVGSNGVSRETVTVERPRYALIMIASVNIVLQLCLIVFARDQPIWMLLLIVFAIGAFVFAIVAEVRRNTRISRGAPFIQR